MCFTGDWSSNWDIFRAEYEDYVLVSGIAEKDEKFQAATLLNVMGSECRHVYHHNLNLSEDEQGAIHFRGKEHCPAFGKKCKLCWTSNHFAKVCQKIKRGSTTGKVHCMDE